MSESKLRNLSMDFSVSIVNLVKDLKAKHESVISNQIGRSGTSIRVMLIASCRTTKGKQQQSAST